MNYPKEQIALENEKIMEDWLFKNQILLPLTIYSIAKGIGWSFGATRGTLLRIEKKRPNIIVKVEVIDEKDKRFKIFYGLKGTQSEDIVLHFKDNFVKSTNSNLEGEDQIIISSDLIQTISKYLNILLQIDGKMSELNKFINNVNILEKILELNIGLDSEEKLELENLITTFS